MALITRISRLFKADFNAVLDHVEEPGILLRQAIREMEQELFSAELGQSQQLDERDRLKVRQDELNQTATEIDEQLDVCFESDEGDLAKTLIKRKLENELLLKRVSARLASAEKDLAILGKSLGDNRAALEGLRQKAELFAGQSQKKDAAYTAADELAWTPCELSVSDSDVEVAFLREKKRRMAS